jgi:lipopolysaccharide export LptBFGC system permease protein LptF
MTQPFDMNNLQSFNLDSIQSFIEQANQTLACDSQCQQKKKAEELKQAYLDSQTNKDTANYQVQVAQKNYVTFTEGELKYNELNTAQWQEKAQKRVETYESAFDKQVDQTESQIKSYSGLLLNMKNVLDLYQKYKTENTDLYNQWKNQRSNILTNERKTYYEDQGIQQLSFYYSYILIILYMVCLLCYAAFSFWYPSLYSWKIRAVVFLLLCLLPWVSSWLLNVLLTITNSLIGWLPKNTHL